MHEVEYIPGDMCIWPFFSDVMTGVALSVSHLVRPFYMDDKEDNQMLNTIYDMALYDIHIYLITVLDLVIIFPKKNQPLDIHDSAH